MIRETITKITPIQSINLPSLLHSMSAHLASLEVLIKYKTQKTMANTSEEMFKVLIVLYTVICE